MAINPLISASGKPEVSMKYRARETEFENARRIHNGLTSTWEQRR